MTKREVIEALVVLLALPDGQKWVSIEDLLELADKLDGNTG